MYAFAIEPSWLRTVRVDLPVAGLPPEFDGYRIAQLSDLHVGCGISESFLRQAVAVANGAAPDLAVVTGDIVDGGGPESAAHDAAALLSDLEARDGTAVVLWTSDGGKSWSEQARVGSESMFSIHVLDDRHAWAVGAQQRRGPDDGSQKLLRYEVVAAE